MRVLYCKARDDIETSFDERSVNEMESEIYIRSLVTLFLLSEHKQGVGVSGIDL